jgi:hypothetical protein
MPAPFVIMVALSALSWAVLIATAMAVSGLLCSLWERQIPTSGNNERLPYG